MNFEFLRRLKPTAWLGSSSANTPKKVRAVRFDTNPLIKPGMANLPGENINGPSLIRVPAWILHPLGKYYLYFADHQGEYIRMAYADELAGPWTIYAPGVLQRTQTVCLKHIASPDVHVDEAKQEIRMYFHGPVKNDEQLSFLSHSKDGLQFTAETQPLGPSYFAVFQYGGWFYTVTKIDGGPGNVYRAKDAATPFQLGPKLIPNMRHSAALVIGDTLWLLFTKIGDAPESIEVVRIDLTKDWQKWPRVMSAPQLVLKPEKDYEGAELPVVPSIVGGSKQMEHALRDPGIFQENGHIYLIYAVAGERGLAMAELFFE
ncbi:MAG: hypothetical protein WDN00_03965 [Limisphaerales bacterium]